MVFANLDKEIGNIPILNNFRFSFRWLWLALTVPLIILGNSQSAVAMSSLDASSPVPAAVKKLLQFCADPKTGLDARAAATLIDYVLENKPEREIGLPVMDESPGAYYEFDTRTAFPRFLSYCYSAQIPGALTRPSSMRYSIWTAINGKSGNLSDKWKLASPGDKPVVIHAAQRDCNTPDLTTGVYYVYDLKRTLIHLNHKGRHAIISISKQVGPSDVGKRGIILGKDDDWNYYYSEETGSYKTGLGWVKSYIYDFLSLGVYVETGASSATVRTGTFQWIRAGWSGINFVKTEHILNGMKRFARNSRTILEAKNLPASSQFIKNYRMLSALPSNELLERYSELQKAQQSMAAQTGKVGKNGNGSPNHVAKEQMVQELMLEYLKICLGKPSLVGKNSFWF